MKKAKSTVNLLTGKTPSEVDKARKKNCFEGKEVLPRKPKVPTLEDLGLTVPSETLSSSSVPLSNSPLLAKNIVGQQGTSNGVKIPRLKLA